ncbi:hypothetical protein [Nannocystis pusilla]|uniref:hypothetical protein n=1 Tax=Nannocystis pusilla TaxID=889268 RepID=UPI003B80472E
MVVLPAEVLPALVPSTSPLLLSSPVLELPPGWVVLAAWPPVVGVVVEPVVGASLELPAAVVEP